MEIKYNIDKKTIDLLNNKLKKFKNGSVKIYKSNINKNAKDILKLTKTQFNNLIKNGMINYKITDSLKKYYSTQKGGNLVNIFKSLLPVASSFAKKLAPALAISSASALTSHGINKALSKKKVKKASGFNVKLNKNDINKINNVLKKLSDQKLINRVIINKQNGGAIFSSLILPLIGSLIPSLISGKGVKPNNFFLKN